MTTETDEPRFYADAPAAARIKEILARKPAGSFLRVRILGGGCSGFQYDYGFGTELAPDDRVFRFDGASVAVDPVSMGLLNGATLRYKTAVGAASFSIDNPNADSHCGCGNSFGA
jgi:iron-sulfur cluster insertion protein